MRALQCFFLRDNRYRQFIDELDVFVLSSLTVSSFYDYRLYVDSVTYGIIKDIGLVGVETFDFDRDMSNKYYAYPKFQVYGMYDTKEYIYFDTDILLSRPVIPASDFMFYENESDNEYLASYRILKEHKRVLEESGVDIPLFLRNYNCGLLYIKDASIKRSYVMTCTRLMKEFYDIGSDNEEDYFRAMHYMEQCFLADLVDGKGKVSFVMDNNYRLAHNNYSYADNYFRDYYNKSSQYSFDDVESFTCFNLFRLGAYGAIHLMDFARKNQPVRDHASKFLELFYPDVFERVSEVKKIHS